jgi:hypothetical protein
MRQNKEECAHLVSRVVRFLQSLIDSTRASDVSFGDGTPTAASLNALKRYIFRRRSTSSALRVLSGGSNLMAFRNDTEQWSRLTIWDSVVKRERIRAAILMHRDNLTDCFNALQVSAC